MSVRLHRAPVPHSDHRRPVPSWFHHRPAVQIEQRTTIQNPTMVFFICDGCGESMKKAKVDAHAAKCRQCFSVSW